MKTQVQETHEKIFELSLMLKSYAATVCPAPGKCLELERDLATVKAQIQQLEMKAAESKGGWKVAAAVSGLLAGVGTWLWNHFTTVKHP